MVCSIVTRGERCVRATHARATRAASVVPVVGTELRPGRGRLRRSRHRSQFLRDPEWFTARHGERRREFAAGIAQGIRCAPCHQVARAGCPQERTIPWRTIPSSIITGSAVQRHALHIRHVRRAGGRRAPLRRTTGI